ncbi:aldehyde dehydrogenase family protein [Lachnoclostridium phytofermentans]|uniref:Aldehyde Dehydrogenase n=1 Tax=Lachnoclostridium phytofermentans (strain ATCC 700394 / DSM 18823 / ISDg) TaxID=357809 RepID=A9KN57_LACP7|nr:aldehyde dehydrogenase family protein [Lachnoclostridium phytofermentans]ABX41556.1 Aldehyde Dehydrogenase [Lachnoclostridium phytofermentans ISDg]
MTVNEQLVQDIIKNVVASMQLTQTNKTELGVFDDMNQAIEAAKEAQLVVKKMSMDQREKIISAIRKKTIEHAETLARMAVEETGMGNVGHKILKHQLVAEKTPGTEDITTTAWSGDRGLTLVEMGPFGVIGAITPCTNPSETIICNTIGMLAGGNTVVFNPHPAAIKTSNFAVQLINEASLSAGGPVNIACSVRKPTLDSSKIMMSHQDIPLIAATGGPGVVTAVLQSGKRGIGAGAGNPPVLVDETADIRKAAEDIINGCTFDNNLPCIAEKEVVAIDAIANELMNYMVKEQGCYAITKEQQEKLTNLVITPKGLNRNCVGKDARTLLGMIGIDVPSNIRCIIFEGEKEHPLISEELMMPILGIVRAKSFDDAVEKAVWLEHGNRHSAHIHSKNVDRITTYAKAIDTAILVKNAPSYAAIGFGGEGFCTFTIASRTGEGLTSASTFTKRRRCVMSDSLCIR